MVPDLVGGGSGPGPGSGALPCRRADRLMLLKAEGELLDCLDLACAHGRAALLRTFDGGWSLS